MLSSLFLLNLLFKQNKGRISSVDAANDIFVSPSFFFLQQEKVPKKNKLIPVLLGITRESVMRVDYETKEVMKTWPLTTLRRWAASPHRYAILLPAFSFLF
jgi:talin